MKSYDYIYAAIRWIFKEMSLTIRDFNFSRFALKEWENPTRSERNTTLAGNTRARIFLEFSRRRNTDLFHFTIFAWTFSVAWNFATSAR